MTGVARRLRRSASAVCVLAALIASTTTASHAAKFKQSSGAARTASWLQRVNIIDETDERGSILAIGPALGLTPAEIARIRHVSGHVGCFLPSPSVGSGALFLTSRQIITAGHILFDAAGHPRSKCFFRTQDPEPLTIDL